MAVDYCHNCDTYIDLDYNVDHEWECLHGDCDHEEDEACPHDNN